MGVNATRFPNRQMDPEYRTGGATGMLAAAARRGTRDAVPAMLYLQRGGLKRRTGPLVLTVHD